MQWAEVFTQDYVIGFILLFFRFAAMFMATPIFSHQNIPTTLKASMAFVFSIVFYSSMPPLDIPINIMSVVVAILSEMLFGLAIGVVLQIAYNVITFAGGQIPIKSKSNSEIERLENIISDRLLKKLKVADSKGMDLLKRS